MAKGDLKGTLTGSVNAVTNPTSATGSVAVAVGDLVFVTMSQQTNLTATGASDNLGNSYSAVNAGTDAGTVAIRSFYSRVTNAGTLTQVDVAASSSTNDASVVADAIEGPFLASPLDANPANTTDATTPFTCPATGTLAQASEVVMAAIALAANQTVAATSPSLLTGTVARANASVGQSRRVVSATTSVTPEFTGTSATAAQVTASFKLDPTQALTPPLYSDAESFPAPTVAPGAVDLTPSLHGDTESFPAPAVAATYALTPALFDEGDAHFSPTVDASAGAQDLTPSLFADGDSFPAATVSPGAVDLQPALHGDTDAFFSATASSTVDLAPTLHSDADAFAAATVAASYGLTPDLYPDTDSFPQPTMSATYDLAAAPFADTDSFYVPAVAPGAVDLAPAAFADGETFFSPTVDASGTQFLQPVAHVDAEAFFAPAVAAGAVDIAPDRFDDTDSFDTATATATYALQAGFLQADDLFFAPVVGQPGLEPDLRPETFLDADAFHGPTVTALAIVTDVGLPRRSWFGPAGGRGPEPASPARRTDRPAEPRST